MSSETTVDLLVVEDDPDDANYIQRLLVEFGSVEERTLEIGQIHRAKRLETAVELLDEEPDVVLLDLELPDSEGLETLDSLVEHAPHLPVVVITGTADADLGPKAIKRGAQDYLRKGRITEEVLHRSVRYAIDRHEQQREIVTLNYRLSVLNRILRQNVRTDLNVVVGQGVELRDHVDPDRQSMVDSLLEAARHAEELTSTAGELTAVLSPDSDVEPDRIDIGRALDEQIARIQERHDVAITVERAADDDLGVEAVPALRSALDQLLSNAVRHGDRDPPRVTVSVETAAETVSLSIADDGVGIPDVRKNLLNDPEARYHERAGIGAGLYLAMTVIERSGGSIHFADNRPRGTVVTVTLPRA